MSSSNLFLGLPIALLVLYFELSLARPFSSFNQPISRSVMWQFSSPVSISFFVSLVPASNLRTSPLFYGIVGASF